MGDKHHHHPHHDDPSRVSEQRLWWAVGANILLTLAQMIGGVFSGSLSLIADALHNFSDAASLVIALVAIRIGRNPPDSFKTFGYKRAETIAALINLTTLIIIGLYLCYQALMRFFHPEPIAGWIIVIVAGIALGIDIFTAALTYSQSRNSMNIKAVFLHNLSDALTSAAVIIGGTLIVLYGWLWTDAVLTLLIAGYVLYHGFHALPKTIHLLMEGTPENINIQDVIVAMESHVDVKNVHHMHIWQLDEQRTALEAHVIINDEGCMDEIKKQLKHLLKDCFAIDHSTLEFAYQNCCDHDLSKKGNEND